MRLDIHFMGYQGENGRVDMIFAVAALVLSALFAGAAFYINFAEHPARMVLPINAARDQWEPAYHRGFIMQAALAILGGIAGFAAWYVLRSPWWIAGAILMLANWPFTLAVIMPVNKQLEGKPADETLVKSLLDRWNKLHAGRTLLGTAAMICYSIALLGATQ